MKFFSGIYQGESMIGVIYTKTNETINLTEASANYGVQLPSTLLACIQMGEEFVRMVHSVLDFVDQETEERPFKIHFEDVQLQAPILRPNKNIFCVGKNYRDHALELGGVEDIPEVPMFFSKSPTSVIGTNEVIQIPTDVTTDIDYEGELAVIIGKRGKRIQTEDAYDFVFGYTIVNDVTARDLQSKHKQFLIGKSMDTSCPMGPVIVHKAAIPDPHDLFITTRVNDEVRQQSSTSNMMFTIPELISDLSKVMTLEPGDIIATGTPAGVGKGFNPPKYLKANDRVTIDIDRIGTLMNTVENEVY
ncbi:fumarylacetoacetate hydrolase family protein [Pseudalkalibacillus berkeleyi]|uniref:Fumarylacetoacetate hydrolase family protein n=1 Tax=Pseudalkalibacillus berkeleyi TaxID=1069813 RepID=A0ABS9GVQ7_9BACL|nr:fumarylacetoacetate hydrolase family protein [Pseudalkalibacillus berkeleyi]MCF6136779.1 fumarylacetoacetate hydrolase family protein [Pseudalkalibacillus berkeleyi]